jgi:hypothetical protein
MREGKECKTTMGKNKERDVGGKLSPTSFYLNVTRQIKKTE